ncbi:MAG: hypothetical protein ACE5IK_09725 [Acidobacteriota bacterium]
MQKGEAIVLPRPGMSFDPGAIPRAIRRAGFTPRSLDVTAAGRLVAVTPDPPAGSTARLVLEMEGPVPRLLLRVSDEDLLAALTARAASNVRIRITGKFDPPAGKAPAVVTVREWEIVAPDGPG